MTALVRHDDACPQKGAGHSDAAKRVSDTYNLHLLAAPHENVGNWFAVRLANGKGDQVLYPTKRAAVIHQHHNEKYYAFIRIGPRSMSVCDAECYLAINRKLYDKGIRLADPDHRAGGMDVIPRLSREDMGSMMRSILSGGKSRPTNLRFPGRN